MWDKKTAALIVRHWKCTRNFRPGHMQKLSVSVHVLPPPHCKFTHFHILQVNKTELPRWRWLELHVGFLTYHGGIHWTLPAGPAVTSGHKCEGILCDSMGLFLGGGSKHLQEMEEGYRVWATKKNYKKNNLKQQVNHKQQWWFTLF